MQILRLSVEALMTALGWIGLSWKEAHYSELFDVEIA